MCKMSVQFGKMTLPNLPVKDILVVIPQVGHRFDRDKETFRVSRVLVLSAVWRIVFRNGIHPT